MKTMHDRAMHHSQAECLRMVQELGGDGLFYRATQVIQYQHQMPRGCLLLVSGVLRLERERGDDDPLYYNAKDATYLIPNPSDLNIPLPWTLRAQTDLHAWFFSRSLCQPGTVVRACLEGMKEPGNLLNQLWSHYVATA